MAMAVSAPSSNRLLLAKLVLLTAGMFGFGYLIAPLYDRLCSVAGLNQARLANTPPRSTQVDQARTITIQYDANLHGSLPWAFRPMQKSTQIHPGQLVQIRYEVTNESGKAVVAQAVPSYAPPAAAAYFYKVECFCFKRQTLQPHETRDMPVVFLIDAAIPADLLTITLSYTLFEVPS
jgi:cytochrome c oxidase assembly protein subunit 11